MSDVTIYTIADRRFFPGVVALVNSLRLTGHHQQIALLDVGLTPAQRRVLSAEVATFHELPRDRVYNPQQYKPFAALFDPSGTVVVIDSDVIVVGDLEPAIEAARAGSISAFPDPEARRWFGEWVEVFGLRAPLRQSTYVNSGFVVHATEHHPELLTRWWECCERIFELPTMYEGARGASAQSDQDALNALLMSEIPEGALRVLPRHGQAYGMHQHLVEVVDAASLDCRWEGQRVTLLHSSGRRKPWERDSWRDVREGRAYVALLRRLLTADDAPLKPDPSDLVPWLRPGSAGRASMASFSAMNALLDPARPALLRLRKRLTGR